MRHTSPQRIKQTLLNIISDMQSHSELFVKKPGKDFVRKRKLSFSQTIQFILAANGNTVRKELLDFFHFSPDCISASGFSQQREKILPDAFDYLFHAFNQSFANASSYRGYRLLACDGSDLAIAYNPTDTQTYRRHNSVELNQKGYNQLHLNALYDLQNRIYLDALIQPGRHPDEAGALIEMIKRSQLHDKTILIADRGYECYNIFAHAQQKGWNYLIRVKDFGSRGIITNLPLPDKETFDCNVHLILTKKQTKEVKANPKLYRYLTNKSRCDFVDIEKNPFYPLDFRIVRFQLTQTTYECIITNLPEKDFPPEEIKKLYGLRWGIERSFRDLKYTIGLTNFHAKKVEYILQEVFARLTLYNYCERIVSEIVIDQKESTKHTYQVNFTIAVHICKCFFTGRVPPPQVEALICRNVLPVREGRKALRKVCPNSAVSFHYRVA